MLAAPCRFVCPAVFRLREEAAKELLSGCNRPGELATIRVNISERHTADSISRALPRAGQGDDAPPRPPVPDRLPMRHTLERMDLGRGGSPGLAPSPEQTT